MQKSKQVRGWDKWWAIARGTVAAYIDDRVPQLGAALAFYTTIAVVPLMLLIVGLAQVIFDSPNTREHVLSEVEQLGGFRGRIDLTPPAEHIHSPMAWLGFIVFLFGGFGVFSHLQNVLNHIWRAPSRTGEPWRAMVRRRLLSFGTVLGTGFIVLVSLALSAAINWLGISATKWAGWPARLAEAGNFVFSFGIITLLFAVIFKLLPDVKILWRDVWTGAAVTALLFDAGKTGLGAYFAHTQMNTLYGAAGSAVALLLWCYYAGQIVFFGAEFTRMHELVRAGDYPRR